MMWWEILKNAKISGKAKGKGSSFDASKIKINIDDKDDCCEEFWKTIQEFRNEHKIVFKVMVGVLSRRTPMKNMLFEGIGHIVYENDTLIMPMSSKEPCKDSYNMFKFIEDIWNHFIINGPSKEWDNYKWNTQGNMYPFEPKHYKKATLNEIRKWPKLVDKFLEGFDELNRAFQNCPELERMDE